MHKYIYLIIILLVTTASSVSAYVASSTNYRIQDDSINIGGLDNSTSTNYKLKDTVGELATGDSNSPNYYMRAGYRQMDEVYLAVTVPSNITLSPNISGVLGGVANGNGIWTVKTDSAAGYNLNIKAVSSPAMQSANSNFADYTPVVVGTPDYSWNLAGANSEFGFSPYNVTSQINKYKNNGASCSIGINITDTKCWYGLSTSDEQIVNSQTRTLISGEDTKINFKAEVNGLQEAGNYSASIIVTVVSN